MDKLNKEVITAKEEIVMNVTLGRIKYDIPKFHYITTEDFLLTYMIATGNKLLTAKKTDMSLAIILTVGLYFFSVLEFLNIFKYRDIKYIIIELAIIIALYMYHKTKWYRDSVGILLARMLGLKVISNNGKIANYYIIEYEEDYYVASISKETKHLFMKGKIYEMYFTTGDDIYQVIYDYVITRKYSLKRISPILFQKLTKLENSKYYNI